MSYQAQPLGRADIRYIAKQFRSLLGIEHLLYIDVLTILEHVMPTLFSGFSYEIVQKQELPSNRHADTDVANRIIRIREDIYYKACAGDGQSRMTVMHEIAHYLLLVVCGVKFARSYSNEPIKPYKDPEWQAMALAGEIMCDTTLIRRLEPGEIKKLCGVSWAAANQAYKNCHKK